MFCQTEGFVLNKQPYRETSYLVDLFTEHHGKIKILARSARGYKATRSFSLLYLGLWTLTEGRDFYFQKTCDLQKYYTITGRQIWAAYYLNELLLRLMPANEPDALLFMAYKEALWALENGGKIEQALRRFEALLLQVLGVFPDLTLDDDNAPVEALRSYFITHDQGIVKHKPCTPFLEVPGAALIALEQGDFTQAMAHVSKKIMRFLITPLLGDKPLQSRIWLEKLYQKTAVQPMESYHD